MERRVGSRRIEGRNAAMKSRQANRTGRLDGLGPMAGRLRPCVLFWIPQVCRQWLDHFLLIGQPVLWLVVHVRFYQREVLSI